tara:strand:+ start:184 stop:600 length:417 start_codon:yes stop_codon:yes gene_type:complete
MLKKHEDSMLYSTVISIVFLISSVVGVFLGFFIMHENVCTIENCEKHSIYFIIPVIISLWLIPCSMLVGHYLRLYLLPELMYSPLTYKEYLDLMQVTHKIQDYNHYTQSSGENPLRLELLKGMEKYHKELAEKELDLQ